MLIKPGITPQISKHVLSPHLLLPTVKESKVTVIGRLLREWETARVRIMMAVPPIMHASVPR